MNPEGYSRDDDAPPRSRKRWHRIAYAPEWEILFFGVLMALFYAFVLRIVHDVSESLFDKLLSTTVVFFLSGRAGGILAGKDLGLPIWLAIGLVMYLETLMVLALFPLFVLSFEELITFRPLLRAAARARRAAATHHDKVMKYGVPGLFLFVWFPFWMTGPLMGAIIGYFMRLRHGVNLTVVLLGTYVAIVCWGWILEPVHARLERLHPAAPLVVVGILVALAVLGFARGVLRRRKKRTPPAVDTAGA